MKKQEIVKKKTIKMQDLDIKNSFLDDKKKGNPAEYRFFCRISLVIFWNVGALKDDHWLT